MNCLMKQIHPVQYINLITCNKLTACKDKNSRVDMEKNRLQTSRHLQKNTVTNNNDAIAFSFSS